jgi:low temperature requirement protein LtrA
MTKKWPLYTGLSLLALGITLKASTSLALYPLLIILTGVGLKVLYIILKIIRKEYKPGLEMVTLFFGLALFLTGVFFFESGLINHGASIALKITGITLKTTFVLLFIRKTRKPLPVVNPAMTKH